MLFVGVFDMLGWMFMGLLGVMFVNGFDVVYIVIGLVVGVFVNYVLVVFKLCVYIEVVDDFFIVFEFFVKCFDNLSVSLCIVFVVIIVMFFILYILVGLVVGGKLFESVFFVNY